MNVDYMQIKAIADHVREIDPDDESLLADMIEGETDAFEVLDKLLEREAELIGYVTGNKARKQDIDARNARFEAQKAACRNAMGKVLEAIGVKKSERPEGTISVARVAPKVLGDNVDGLPDHLVKTERKADKAAIKSALQSGADVPGWSMSNGGETIKVARK